MEEAEGGWRRKLMEEAGGGRAGRGGGGSLPQNHLHFCFCSSEPSCPLSGLLLISPRICFEANTGLSRKTRPSASTTRPLPEDEGFG